MTTIYVSEETHSLLKRIKRERRKKDLEDVIAFLIAQYEGNKNVAPENPQVENEELKCINRIFHQGYYWCVHKPPRMVKLPTLDICAVCKKRKIGLPSVAGNFSIPETEPDKAIEKFKMMIPQDVEKLITIEDGGDHFKVRPKYYLPNKDFQRLAYVMKQFNGEYLNPLHDKPFFKIKKRGWENENFG